MYKEGHCRRMQHFRPSNKTLPGFVFLFFFAAVCRSQTGGNKGTGALLKQVYPDLVTLTHERFLDHS